MVLGVVLLSPLWLKEVVTVIAQEGSTMVVRVQAKRVGGRLMICPSLWVEEARKVAEIECSEVLYLLHSGVCQAYAFPFSPTNIAKPRGWAQVKQAVEW